MKNQTGFGLIGCGTWGEAHARTYVNSSSANLVAVCDTNKQVAEKVAKQHGVTNYYDNVHDLLANPDIKAVSVVTPDFLHTDIVCAALEAGKNVLVEKPLAMTVAECEKIAEEIGVEFRRRVLDVVG